MEVGSAQNRVYKAKAGKVRRRPISAPEFLEQNPPDTARGHPTSSRTPPRPKTVMEIAGHLVRPISAASALYGK